MYANEPLNATTSSSSSNTSAPSSRNGVFKRVRTSRSSQNSQLVQIPVRAGSRNGSGSPDVLPLIMAGVEAGAIDPFDTYPATNLPRARVQGLIHHCMSCHPRFPCYL